MPSIGGYHPYGLASILTGLESNRACVAYAWPTNCSPSTPLTCLPELRGALLDEWCNIPQDQIDNLILSMPGRCTCSRTKEGRGSRVVKVSDHGRHVMSSSRVPLKTRRVEQRCTLNLSRAQTSSRWCGVVVRRGSASSGVVLVT
ncbi:uncharacterized protein TNCV_2714261 [Trichonephila clavipes]|nr:uncharacterized protein TNCV_2714261 [Trichonephila clavipes]